MRYSLRRAVSLDSVDVALITQRSGIRKAQPFRSEESTPLLQLLIRLRQDFLSIGEIDGIFSNVFTQCDDGTSSN
jgi:hypothetical protein